MRAEAYTVSYDRQNYQAPIPVGYTHQEILKKREDGIRNNILRYLGEYRLGVKFDEFFYEEETDLASRQKYLRAFEPGPVREVFRRAIRAREERGQSTRREVAECLGFQKLEQELLNTSDPKLFIWVSPPGPREDGYGLHSFTFIGQALEDPNTHRKEIRVIPYRNILTLEEHRRCLSYFSSEAEGFVKDINFLSHPIVFAPTQSVRTPEDMLTVIGEQEKFNTVWMGRLKDRVGGLIDGYIDMVRIGASDGELTKARNAIENYTIAIKKDIDGKAVLTDGFTLTVLEMFDKWGVNDPPKVAGSCGSTMNEYHKEYNKPWEYHLGECVVCHAKYTDVGPCDICKNCEKEFDAQGTVAQAA